MKAKKFAFPHPQPNKFLILAFSWENEEEKVFCPFNFLPFWEKALCCFPSCRQSFGLVVGWSVELIPLLLPSSPLSLIFLSSADAPFWGFGMSPQGIQRVKVAHSSVCEFEMRKVSIRLHHL